MACTRFWIHECPSWWSSCRARSMMLWLLSWELWPRPGFQASLVTDTLLSRLRSSSLNYNRCCLRFQCGELSTHHHSWLLVSESLHHKCHLSVLKKSWRIHFCLYRWKFHFLQFVLCVCYLFGLNDHCLCQTCFECKLRECSPIW